MKDKIIEILVRIAHISESAKALAEELDKMYSTLADNGFLEMLEKEIQ